MAIFVILMMSLSTFYSNNVDYIGHFGGFLVGFMIGLALIEPVKFEKYERNVKIMGICGSIVFYLVCFITFYTLN